MKPAELHAFFDLALAVGAMVHLHEAHNPGAGEELIRWARGRDLRVPVELKHDPLLGSWRTTKVEHERCTIAVDSAVDRSTRERTPVFEFGVDGVSSWRPSDGAPK